MVTRNGRKGHAPKKVRTSGGWYGIGRVPYVSECAAHLGCTKGHLWRVVVGDRQSPRLLAAYKRYVAERQASN